MVVKQPPNMRLAVGPIALMESEWLCANALELSFNYTAPGGHAARSLSAFR